MADATDGGADAVPLVKRGKGTTLKRGHEREGRMGTKERTDGRPHGYVDGTPRIS